VVARGLLEDLVRQGLKTNRKYLFVIDGSKAVRAAVERVLGERAEVQRSQWHKRRNVKEHVPEQCGAEYDRQIRAAYAMSGYAEGNRASRESGVSCVT
jgi:putative transposase